MITNATMTIRNSLHAPRVPVLGRRGAIPRLQCGASAQLVRSTEAQPHAGRGEDGVAERGCRDGGADLAEAAGRLGALDAIDLDLRRLVHPQIAVVVEVALLDGAVLQGDVAVQRGAQAEEQAALNLRLDGARIDGDAAVDRGDRAAQPHLALRRHLGLDDEAHMAAERRAERDAAPDPRGQGARAPADFARGQIEHAQRARVLGEQRAPVVERILAGGMRELVHEALDHEQVVRRTDAAPPADARARRACRAAPSSRRGSECRRASRRRTR